MQCLLAAFATFSTWTVRKCCQTTSSRVQRQGVHQLGTVCGHAVLPGSAYEFAARSLPGVGRLRIASEASGHQLCAEEIDPGLCQRQPPVGTLRVYLYAIVGQMPGRDGGAQPSQVSFQEQADEPGRQHHRTVGYDVRLGQVSPAEGRDQATPAVGSRRLSALVRCGDRRQTQRVESRAELASGSRYDPGHRSRLQRLRLVRAVDQGRGLLRDPHEDQHGLHDGRGVCGSRKGQRAQRPDRLSAFPGQGWRGTGLVPADRVLERGQAGGPGVLHQSSAPGGFDGGCDLQREVANETVFKALKQTAKVKSFLGTSANAVKTQIWTALIAMLILKYLQMKSSFGWSLSNLAALLRQQLFIFRDLWAWLNNPLEGPPAARQLAEQLPMPLIW